MGKLKFRLFDMQVLKYAPDQMLVRLNAIVKWLNEHHDNHTITVEKNGWTVYDYGTWQEWEKVVPYNVNVTNGQRTSAANIDLPAGYTTADFSYLCTGFGGYAGHAVYGVEQVDADTIALYIGNQYSGGALTYTGTAYIRLRKLPS